MPKTVLLTGASGYIAQHIALQLLEAGYHVLGTVRDLSRGAEVMAAIRPHMKDPTDVQTRLTFIALDLTQDDGWSVAMKGVDVLMHTASPFPMVQPKNESDLIQPAVDGTLRALRAAHDSGVRRVIITSSTAAISGSPLPPGDTSYDETNWTNPDDSAITAYSKSKTLAEQAAWAFVQNEAPDMQLTIINPGFVVGAPLGDRFGTSIAVIERLLLGKDPMLPRLGFSVVDVQDVAEMHVTVIAKPETIGQRIMTVDRFMWFHDMAQAIKQAYPDRKTVTRVAPNFLIRILGRFDPAIKSIVPSLGRQEKTDNSRARATLGRGMRQAPVGVVSAAKHLIKNTNL